MSVKIRYRKRFAAIAMAVVTGLASLSLPADTVRAEEAVQAGQQTAEEQDAYWNYEKEVTETQGAFIYHAFTSQDEKEVWIYEISINLGKDYRYLYIPETLDGKKVTRLGYTEKKDPDRDDSYYRNIFGIVVEYYHDCPGEMPFAQGRGIKIINLPDSLEVIQPGAFSGLNDLTDIKIPKQVTAIEEYLFYGCESLKEVTLPKALKDLDPLAFVDCPKLEKLVLSSPNEVYQIENLCVITKADQALVFTFSKEDTLKIPKGVKIIKEYAMSGCTSSVVNIPASVKEIEARAFNINDFHQNENIKDVTISKKNKVYAKDGQCIYHKKNQTLAVGIPDDKGVIYVSEKVRHLTDSYSLVNCDIYEDRLEKVVLPKKLETVTVKGFRPLTTARNVYFTGTTPPQVKQKMKGFSSLPTNANIYVPKKSYQEYKKWYKTYHCWKWVKMYKV